MCSGCCGVADGVDRQMGAVYSSFHCSNNGLGTRLILVASNYNIAPVEWSYMIACSLANLQTRLPACMSYYGSTLTVLFYLWGQLRVANGVNFMFISFTDMVCLFLNEAL